MPRGLDSDEDHELKGGRRTTRATATAAAPNTPIRRSARNRHGSVNPDGSSPESIADSVSSNSKINTRRRAANLEPAKVTRSGKNTRRASVEPGDLDHAPSTPTVRTTRRSIAVVTPVERPKPTTRNTKRVKRTSDSESSPVPIRVTRRTRAMSAEPEFTAQSTASNLSTSHEGTPTRTRRGRALALPKEPAVVEEVEEVNSRLSVIVVSDDSENSMQDHSSARLSTIQSSPKNMSRTEHISESHIGVEDDDKDDVTANESQSKSSKNSLSPTEKSSDNDSFVTQKSMSPVLESEPSKISIKRKSKDAIEVDRETENVKVSTPKPPIVSKTSELDKSKEVGVKIEDLLNKSLEKQQKSPGNKENEKINVTPEKLKKNLEFDMSPARVVISRRSSNSTPLTEKYSKSKLNHSLDEQVLSGNSLAKASATSIDGDNIKSRRSKTLDIKPANEATTPDTDTEISIISPSLSSTSTGQLTSDLNKEKSDHCFVKLEKLAIDNEASEEFVLFDSTESLEPVSNAIAGKKNPEEVDDDKTHGVESSIDEEVSSRSNLSKTKLSEDENSPEQRPSRKNKNDDDDEKSGKHEKNDEAKSMNKSRRSSLKSQGSDTPNKSENTDMKRGSVFDSPPTEPADNEKEKKKAKSTTPKKDEEMVVEEDSSAKKDSVEIYKPESPSDSDASLKSREEQFVIKNIDNEEKSEEKSRSPKTKKSKKHASLRVSDAESDTVIDGLFQDISADEWVSKYKNCSLADANLELQTSGSKAWPKSISGNTSTSDSETSTDRHFGEITNPGAKETERKSTQIIVDIQDSDGEFVVESTNDTSSNRRKSSSKSAKSTASPAQRDNSETHLSDVEDGSAKFSTDSSNNEQQTNGKSTTVKDTEVEEKPKTPKNLETKSSDKKSAEKSRKSISTICVESSDDEAAWVGVDSTKKLKNRTPASNKKQKEKNTPVSNKSYSTLAFVDSESQSEDETDVDDVPSVENSRLMPSFLFRYNSSESENSEKSDVDNSMDSDIAKEMNLAGDSIVAYSDDDVPGDECRASESEQSDEDDDGSDLINFVVDDDEGESTAESEPSANEAEEEPTTKNSYKRLLNVFTSDEEEADDKTEEKSANATAETTTEDEDIKEDEEKVDEQITQNNKRKSNVTDETETKAEEEADAKDGNNEVEEDEEEREGVEEVEVEEEEDGAYETVEEEDEVEADTEDEEDEDKSDQLQVPLKTPRRSLGETDSSKLQSSTKKSKRSLELDKSQSPKNAKKHKYVKDTTPLAPLLDINLPKSIKKLKKLHKSLDMCDTTINICTPDPSTSSDFKAAVTSSSSKDNSASKKSKLKKLKKSFANLDATIDLVTPDSAVPKSVDSKSAPVTPALDKEIINSKKKLKKLRESYAKADATIESEASDKDDEYLSVSKLASVRQSSRANTSIDTLSGKKKRKSISQDDAEVLDASMRLHNESNASGKHDPKMKTPKSGSETNTVTRRRSLTCETPRNVSKLNKTVMTPSSETPQTKFLRKERLNESLPVMELNGRRKTFTKSELLVDMTEDDGENLDSDGDVKGEESKESGNERGEANDESFDIEDDVFDDGTQGDEDKNNQDDRSNDENDEEKDHQEIEIEPEEEDEELSEDQKKSKKKKNKSLTENVEEPVDHGSKKKQKKKSTKSKNVVEPSESLVKKKGKKRKADLLNDDEIVPADTKVTSKSSTKLASATSNSKDNSYENSESKSKIVQKMKKPKNTSASKADEDPKKKVKQEKIPESDSESDDAPDTLDFVKAREDALTTMKNIAANLKVAMEAKKKKRKDQLEKIRLEKEAKLKKSTKQGKVKLEPGNVTLKRLPEDVLQNLSDTPNNQPQKRRKLMKGEEIIVPSKSMFSSDKIMKTRIKVDNTTGSTSSSGGTTQFDVVSIERVKKEPKKAIAVASFRDRMLARNPRQAFSAYQVHQAKQKASGKDAFARRKK